MPFESMPAVTPSKKETPKKIEVKELADNLGKKFSKLFKVLAIMGAVAVPVEACAPIELSPTAASVGKTKKDVRERDNECAGGIIQARLIKESNMRPSSGWAQSVLLADVAEQKFSACVVQSKYGIWDEKTYKEGQAALAAAKEAYDKK
jgi:hypothetical protein